MLYHSNLEKGGRKRAPQHMNTSRRQPRGHTSTEPHSKLQDACRTQEDVRGGQTTKTKRKNQTPVYHHHHHHQIQGSRPESPSQIPIINNCGNCVTRHQTKKGLLGYDSLVAQQLERVRVEGVLWKRKENIQKRVGRKNTHEVRNIYTYI